MATVVLVGTLDTKGEEYAYLRHRVREHGAMPLVVDCGVHGEPPFEPDILADEVAQAAGTTLEALRAADDRGAAMTAMGRGAAAVVSRLHDEGRCDGVVALGGSGGTSVATEAMRALPVGVPKVMVSTMGSGDVRPYVGAVDIAMLYSVVDIAGINELSARILANAAAAIAGMAQIVPPPVGEARPLVAASMFGVTTPCVTAARERLEELGYEVLVFHATGSGGQSMEQLMRDGYITAALDITTTELADELVGGVLSAGPQRLEAAGELGLAQVVSLGALDMVNFGPPASIPERFDGRRFYEHNPTVTLMRTTAAECAELGRRIAAKLNRAKGPVSLFVPLGGVSVIDTPGQPFHDPDADAALFGELRQHVDPGVVELVELDTDINDPDFARALADRLHAHVEASQGVAP